MRHPSTFPSQLHAEHVDIENSLQGEDSTLLGSVSAMSHPTIALQGPFQSHNPVAISTEAEPSAPMPRPPKRKLDNSVAVDATTESSTGPNRTSEAPFPKPTNFESLSAQDFGQRATADPRATQLQSSTGTFTGDRRRFTISQLSKRLGTGLNSIPKASKAGDQRPKFVFASQTTGRPTSSDTVPLQRQANQLTKVKKSSEHAKNFIIPTTRPVSAPTKGKKREKFVPPLVSGGYAEKFLNLLNYQKSEYLMWANATLRHEKLFEATDPIATVEVLKINREYKLQWTVCRIIYNENNRPPFDIPPPIVAPVTALTRGERDYGSQQTTETSVTSETYNPLDITLESYTAPDTNDEDHRPTHDRRVEDSINGIHVDMDTLGILSSSQGSELGGSFGAELRRSQIWYNPGNMQNAFNSGEGPSRRTKVTPALRHLKSSQGSEDGLGSIEEHMLIPDISMILSTSEGSQEHSLFQHDDWTSQESAGTESTTSATGNGSSPVYSDIFEPPKVNRRGSHQSVQPHYNRIIVFSNLFNLSALKVTDQIEIHEPCRQLSVPLPGLEPGSRGNNADALPVLVVERYRVVSKIQ